MEQKHFHFNEKKRVVVKIGSSSLNYGETGNLNFTKLADDAVLMETDVLTALKRLEGKAVFDIVFMDPPYNHEYEKDVLTYLADSKLIDEYSIIVVEASNETSFDYLENIGFYSYKIKKYKNNMHVFIRKNK